jgi:hypothetical protein
MSNVQSEFENYFSLFRMEKHAPDFPLYDSPEARNILKTRAASYGGLISISHFMRAFSELVASGTIPQLRQRRPVTPEAPELTADEYYSMSAADVVRRYGNEPAFHDSVDRLIADGKI